MWTRMRLMSSLGKKTTVLTLLSRRILSICDDAPAHSPALSPILLSHLMSLTYVSDSYIRALGSRSWLDTLVFFGSPFLASPLLLGYGVGKRSWNNRLALGTRLLKKWLSRGG
jgi:hypothetical protein